MNISQFIVLFLFSLVRGRVWIEREPTLHLQDNTVQMPPENLLNQGPCVFHAESGQCISYDSRYQAATIEEAMFAFIDLNSNPTQNRLVDPNTFHCDSLECKTCFGLLYYRLLDIGLLDLSFRPITSILPRDQLNVTNCSRFKFSSSPPTLPAPHPIDPHVQSMIQTSHQYSKYSSSNLPSGILANYLGIGTKFRKSQKHQTSTRKVKRESPVKKIKEIDIVGKRFQIACSSKGDAKDDLMSLCGSCWTWRQLPEDYFPRLINELSCQENDYCLSGWGQCAQQFRNVDVLRRQGDEWIPIAISTAIYCDCKVKAGTEIHSLVVGKKKS